MSHKVIPVINYARSEPGKFGQEIYNKYKSSFVGNEMTAFGKRIQTFEGIDALQDLYHHLSQANPTSNLIESGVLNRVAEEIAREKGQRGQLSHESPKIINQKVSKYGKIQGKVGQLICLNTYTPEECSTYFLIDDGLFSRKRRRMLLDNGYRYVGTGSANHLTHGTITVLLFAQNIKE